MWWQFYSTLMRNASECQTSRFRVLYTYFHNFFTLSLPQFFYNKKKSRKIYGNFAFFHTAQTTHLSHKKFLLTHKQEIKNEKFKKNHNYFHDTTHVEKWWGILKNRNLLPFYYLLQVEKNNGNKNFNRFSIKKIRLQTFLGNIARNINRI